MGKGGGEGKEKNKMCVICYTESRTKKITITNTLACIRIFFHLSCIRQRSTHTKCRRQYRPD